MSQRPGVMLFFDVRPALKRLTIEERGRLFEAILDYGELGLLPEFEGGLGIVWDFIQPRIDQDAARYADRVLKTKYSVYAREAKKAGIQPVEFEIWRTDPDAFYRAISSDANRYPTTTTAPTPTTTATTASTTETTSAANSAADMGVENEISDFNRKRNAALQILTDWQRGSHFG